MKIYKIQDVKTGLWSCGGQAPVRFNKTGKSWNGMGPLKNHLKYADIKPTWQLIEFVMSADEYSRIPVIDFLNSPEEKAKEVKKLRAKERRKKEALQEERNYLQNQIKDLESRLNRL